MKRYVYRLGEEELWELLAHEGVPLQVIGKGSCGVEFATYEPLKGLRPLRIEEVREDWEEWRSAFGPVEAGDIVILPPWKKVVFIKPGMAFGTGLHPTTRLCLSALQEFLKEGDSVLDVGTGSGILAIASKVLGAGRVVGIDISEEAVRECRENARLNGVDVECVLGRPEDVEGTFDLVVANLEIGVFRKDLYAILPLSKGKFIFSGLYGKGDLEEFTRLLLRRGLKPSRIFEDEGWFCVGVGDAGDKEGG
ncbi:MAG: 50S ribosomal protein L11 methyltransferase [Aquificota bacterium]|nr:50S ribosomal protein L11 methyltransferase [Aquificota bacterium]